MDRYTKNALWDYWRRGDDEEVIIDDELSNPGDENLMGENKIAKSFGSILIYSTSRPLYAKHLKSLIISSRFMMMCLLKIYLNLKLMKNIKMIGSTNGYCNMRDLPGMIREGNSICYQDYEWYDALEDSDLKNEALITKAILEESMNVEEESSDDAWSHYSPIDEWKNYEHTTYIETDNEEWFDEHELMKDDDDDIDDLEDYLIQKDPPYYVNKEEERSKERRCKLLGIPYVKPPTCKPKKFKVVKYSLGPEEEYVAIKEYEYDIWVRTKENVSEVYQYIFQKRMKDGP
ncbi:hypothetical protein Tco_1328449 [Tanacetum coccineum]